MLPPATRIETVAASDSRQAARKASTNTGDRGKPPDDAIAADSATPTLVKAVPALSAKGAPVREAFGILQHQGLVRVHAQRGATVLVPTVQELEEHYEIRVALECLAAEHAAIRFRPEDAPRLRAMLRKMRECRDPDRYVELNHNFHMAVYALSGRHRLIEIIEQLRMASQAYLQINSEQVVPTGDAEHEHDDILAACEANDPDRARRATRQHLQLTVSNVTAQLRQHDGVHPLE